jgi:hypothetical protein
MKAEFKIFTHVQTKQIMDIILMSFVNMIRLIEETERYFELKDEDNLYLLLIKVSMILLRKEEKSVFVFNKFRSETVTLKKY